MNKNSLNENEYFYIYNGSVVKSDNKRTVNKIPIVIGNNYNSQNNFYKIDTMIKNNLDLINPSPKNTNK